MRYGMKPGDAPDFAVGTQKSKPIRQGDILHQMLLRFRGNWVVTGGSGVGTIHPDSIWRLVRSITIKGKGGDMQQVTGQTLRLIEKYFGGPNGVLVQDPPTLLAAATNEAIELQLPIPFFMGRSKRPDEFAFPTGDTASPALYVSWANPTELAFGMDGVPTLTGAVVEVYTEPLYGAPSNAANYNPLMIATKEIQISGNVARDRIYLGDVAFPGAELRGVIVETFDTPASGNIYDSAVIDDLSFNVNGQDEFESTPFAVLQNRNKATYQLSALETGVAILDAAENRRTGAGDLWTIRGTQQPYIQYKATLQTGATNLIRATALFTRGRINPKDAQ